MNVMKTISVKIDKKNLAVSKDYSIDLKAENCWYSFDGLHYYDLNGELKQECCIGFKKRDDSNRS